MHRQRIYPYLLTALSLTAFTLAVPVVAQDCGLASETWVSVGDPPEQRYEIHFVTGTSEGVVTIDWYHNNQVGWRATGEYICSSGATICFLDFPLWASRSTVSLPFESFENDGNAYLVVPSFHQSIYNGDRGGPTESEPLYRGLSVDWQNGYGPLEDEFVLAPNVYKSAGC